MPPRSKPLALTDAQLDLIHRMAWPLAPADRGAYLEAVAQALQAQPTIRRRHGASHRGRDAAALLDAAVAGAQDRQREVGAPKSSDLEDFASRARLITLDRNGPQSGPKRVTHRRRHYRCPVSFTARAEQSYKQKALLRRLRKIVPNENDLPAHRIATIVLLENIARAAHCRCPVSCTARALAQDDARRRPALH
jgi:hypothetical protein